MSINSFDVKSSTKISPFSKSIEVDSDKSISIRSFLISSISLNISSIKNVLESEDVLASINCLKKLSIKIIKIKKGEYKVFGKGLGSLNCKKNTILNCQNSGTLARLLIGILATTPNIKVIIKGDHSLNKRNMKKLIEIMNEFGAEFFPKNKFNFPLKLVASEMPVGINYTSGVSAQVKSAVILAGLNSFGDTIIFESRKSRDHTENMLKQNVGSIKIRKAKKNIINVYGKKQLKNFNIRVPGDPSSAAFFSALTLLSNNSKLVIKNVQLNPTRTGFYDILRKSGAKIYFSKVKIINGEKIGNIFIKSSKIKALKASSDYYVKSTDEYPILFVIAALTPGVSEFSGVEDLANKESNRILEIKKILKQIKVKLKFSGGKVQIYGKKFQKIKYSITIPNLGDHRICMSALVLSQLTGCKIYIKNFETVNTSSPSFLKLIKKLGGKFEIKKN